MKSYDLTLDNKGRVTAWNTGFFEHGASLSFNQFDPDDYFTVTVRNVEYRINKHEYNTKKEVFDKFIKR